MKNCLACEKLFTPNRNRQKYCSIKCNYDRFRNTFCGALWTEEEEHLLLLLIGTMPSKEIIAAYRKQASEFDFPNRANSAIQQKLKKLAQRDNLTLQCTEDNFSIASAAKNLGVSKWLLHKFIREKKLSVRTIERNQKAISKKNLKKLVLANPSYFCQCDSINLFWLLEDRDAVKAVQKVEPTIITKGRPVKVTDGTIVYSSMRQAASFNFCHKSVIKKALETNAIVNNKRFYKV